MQYRMMASQRWHHDAIARKHEQSCRSFATDTSFRALNPEGPLIRPAVRVEKTQNIFFNAQFGSNFSCTLHHDRRVILLRSTKFQKNKNKNHVSPCEYKTLATRVPTICSAPTRASSMPATLMYNPILKELRMRSCASSTSGSVLNLDQPLAFNV